MSRPDFDPHRHPGESCCPELFDLYPPESSIGKTLRKVDAQRRIHDILAAEGRTGEQEESIARMSDAVDRMMAEHDLNMQYLITYGVRADERHIFQELLQEVAIHGDLSLSEVARITHVTAQRMASSATSENEDVSSAVPS